MSFEVDTGPLRALIEDIEGIEVDSDDILHEMGRVVADRTVMRMGQERSPDGTPFRDLSPDYAKRKGGGSILYATGRLAGSIQHVIADIDEVDIGSDLFRARFHQGTRPFLGFDDLEHELIDIASDALEEAFSRAA